MNLNPSSIIIAGGRVWLGQSQPYASELSCELRKRGLVRMIIDRWSTEVFRWSVLKYWSLLKWVEVYLPTDMILLKAYFSPPLTTNWSFTLFLSFISWSISCWRGNTNYTPHQRRKLVEKMSSNFFQPFFCWEGLADRDIRYIQLIISPLVLTCELRKWAGYFYFSLNVWIMTNNLILCTDHSLVNVATPKICCLGMSQSCVLETE